MKLFDRISDTAPSFVARENRGDIRLRGYLHEAGLDTAFDSDKVEAFDYLKSVYNAHQETLGGYNWAIGAVWGKGYDKMRDLYLLGDLDVSEDLKIWQSANPDIRPIVFKNGMKADDFVNCGDA